MHGAVTRTGDRSICLDNIGGENALGEVSRLGAGI